MRKAIRDLSFATGFDPKDMNDWQVCRSEDDGYIFRARRTISDEIFEGSERAALRKFLYGMDLPDALDVASIKIEQASAEFMLSTSMDEPDPRPCPLTAAAMAEMGIDEPEPDPVF